MFPGVPIFGCCFVFNYGAPATGPSVCLLLPSGAHGHHLGDFGQGQMLGFIFQHHGSHMGIVDTSMYDYVYV